MKLCNTCGGLRKKSTAQPDKCHACVSRETGKEPADNPVCVIALIALGAWGIALAAKAEKA